MAEITTPAERVARIRTALSHLEDAEKDYQEACAVEERTGGLDIDAAENWDDAQLNALNAILADLDPLLETLEYQWGLRA